MANYLLVLMFFTVNQLETWLTRDLGVSRVQIEVVMLNDLKLRLKHDLMKSEQLAEKLVFEAHLTVQRSRNSAKVRELEEAERWAAEAKKVAEAQEPELPK